MDSPLCKLCGVRHWPSEGHKFTETAVAKINEALPKDVPITPKSGEVCPTCGQRRPMTGAERVRRHRARMRR